MTARDAGIEAQRADDVAAVVIGRNEGERLRRCLLSLADAVRSIVYVDSGSTDGSVALARQLGAHVVTLDDGQPFTAARARNAGFHHLDPHEETLAAVQFVDGDCEVEPGWIATARAFLDTHEEAAAVFGRRRERFAEQSVYNRLCDLEWSIAPGEVRSCGGDAMIRAEALRNVGGYRPDLIAGEEPELCVRLRRQGWKIFCIDHPMTLHDAAMTRFPQWWRRSMRAGYSFILGAHIHGGPPEYHNVAETRRAWIWGLGIPLAIMASAVAFGPWAFLLALVYPVQVLRLYLKRRGTPLPLASSFFHVLGRFPEAAGQIKFLRDRLMGRKGMLIEYK
ncbi:glycosyltransferase [Hyphomicrobium sp.]|uniref:glycosyltransferase n=1 Tax=Hyphomicrobium sp. TaxID=82 RepID=UPI002FE32347